ncbi:hypothetical protein GTO91_14845 [Heliobacterium undosum]|uniref:Uncharacterized protein n=1 Tax=Heliomicrobium undosum TaxID=121734 RepID=A0A845L3Y2_9FIRM|nr:hypothetical protein [Heliomicrobium undosum]MZP30993.1 hypothetical protein [Heliomicrobium undosum]
MFGLYRNPRLIFAFMFVVTVSIFGLWFYLDQKHIEAKIAESPLYDTNDFRSIGNLGITLDEPDDAPKISREKAIEAAKAYSGNAFASAKSIHIQYTLVTDTGVFPNNISKIAAAKNPKLTETDYLYKTPVWLVTLQGLNEANEINEPTTPEGPAFAGRRKINRRFLYIDAMTGECISTLGVGS